MNDPTVVPTVNNERGGLDLHMGDLSDPSNATSPVWRMGGWVIQFVRIAPTGSVDVDQTSGRIFVKVIAGRIEGRTTGAYPAVGTIAATQWSADTVRCAEGALIAVFTETAEVPDNVRDMGELTVTGPLPEAFTWQSFEEKFGALTDFFDGKAAYMVPGFHLLDGNDREYAYVHFWTTGKGVDVSTHNHAQAPSPLAPAFAEVHLALNNGTGRGGMYLTESPDAETRQRCVLRRGDEHGPFFDFDPESRRPVLLPNGAVSYPWHGWEGGTDDKNGQAFDLVAAFEITTDYAVV